jgi:DNA primase
MSRSNFDKSAIPPTLTLLQAHFDRVPRPSGGRLVVRCNFSDHRDRTPSMAWNLETGKFHCFGCGRHGDAIDYLMIRYGWDFKRAAQSLGAWHDHTTPEQMQEFCRRQAEQERERDKRAAQREAERLERIDARNHLHAVETLYQESIAEHDWYLMSELLPRVRQAEARYWQMAGLEVRHER